MKESFINDTNITEQVEYLFKDKTLSESSFNSFEKETLEKTASEFIKAYLLNHSFKWFPPNEQNDSLREHLQFISKIRHIVCLLHNNESKCFIEALNDSFSKAIQVK